MNNPYTNCAFKNRIVFLVSNLIECVGSFIRRLFGEKPPQTPEEKKKAHYYSVLGAKFAICRLIASMYTGKPMSEFEGKIGPKTLAEMMEKYPYKEENENHESPDNSNNIVIISVDTYDGKELLVLRRWNRCPLDDNWYARDIGVAFELRQVPELINNIRSLVPEKESEDYSERVSCSRSKDC